jgi:hypothetical protein
VRVLLLFRLFLSPVQAASVSAAFDSAASTGTLACQVYSATDSGSSLGYATAPLAITSSRWPVWEDAILVAPSGITLSSRLGFSSNASAALLAAAANTTLLCGARNASVQLGAAAAAGAGNRSGCSNATLWSSPDLGLSLSNTSLLYRLTLSPADLLDVVAAEWAPLPLPNSSSASDTTSAAAAFTLTLTGASLIVLRSPRALALG